MTALARACAVQLAQSSAFRAKCDIARIASRIDGRPRAFSGLGEQGARILIGDDTAAIPDGDGYLLFAAEGMLPHFLDADPYFAGFSSVMVNVNDVFAMGGRPLAVVDAYFHAPSSAVGDVFAGVRDACEAFHVPLVGGHTTCRDGGPHRLAVAIVGRARRLLTSFGARPGDEILLAVDLRGAYRGDFPFFDATRGRQGDVLSDLAVLGDLAAGGSVHACKDVSNAGIAGTLLMLCEASGIGGVLELERLPAPSGVALERWLMTFPSYGFLLAVNPSEASAVARAFSARGIVCAAVGHADGSRVLKLAAEGEEAVLWDLRERPFTGFGRAA